MTARLPRPAAVLLPALAAPAAAQPGPPDKPGIRTKGGKGGKGRRIDKVREKLLRQRMGLDEATAKKVETSVKPSRWLSCSYTSWPDAARPV